MLACPEVIMKLARVLIGVVAASSLLAALLSPFATAQASEDEAFGHALTLVQMFVRSAMLSDDPKAGLRALDDVLSGRNTEANHAFAGLFEEATSDMPAQHRDKVAAIGRDLAGAARKEIGKDIGKEQARLDTQPAVFDRPRSAEAALQARKDLTAMGLRYYDGAQFLDAVKRDDTLAVELYLAGRGVDVSGKGSDGRSALDIARANRNERLVALLSRNLP
jgi:hypothetical protein